MEGTTVAPQAKTFLEIEPLKLSGLNTLHRHQDGFISIGLGDGSDRLEHLASIRASNIENLFPLFQEQLAKDSYISVNADWKETNSRNRSGSAHRKYHSASTLKYLCAAYCDIDFYNAGLDIETAKYLLGLAVRDGRIPRFSVLVESGRGLWVLWLLRDKANPELAHNGAFPDKLILYGNIQREIIRRLSHIGADAQGCDAARHIRLEGSFHTGAEQFVTWSVHGTGLTNASVHAYTLQEMGEFFGVTPSPARYSEKQLTPGRAKGHLAAGEAKVKCIELLFELRGGFRKGYRNGGIYLYAIALRGAHHSEPDALRRVTRMARDCKPSCYASEARSAVRSAYGVKTSLLNYNKIADWLKVTRAEAERLSQWTGKPFPAAGDEKIPGRFPTRLQNQQRTERRQAIQRIVGVGTVPSYREMQEILASQGVVASHVTVRADYRALGIESVDTRNRKDVAEIKTRQTSLLPC